MEEEEGGGGDMQLCECASVDVVWYREGMERCGKGRVWRGVVKGGYGEVW